MPTGRKPKWDYKWLADQFNLFHAQSLRRVDIATVRQDIQNNRQLFERLAMEQPSLLSAYFWLHEIVHTDLTEEKFFSGFFPRTLVPFLKDFLPDPHYTPDLPPWFVRLTKAWLRRQELGVSREQPDEYDYWAIEPIMASLSLYLMSNCLQDERFRWVERKVQRIWRIRRKYKRPEDWYRWLYSQQEDAVARLGSPWDTRDPSRRRTGGYWGEPADERVTRGIDHGPYDFPLYDYRSHLRQLVLLAGGDVLSETWEDWIEALIWELRPRYGLLGWPDGARASWLRQTTLVNIFVAGNRNLHGAPETEPFVSFDDRRSSEGVLRVEIPSRWGSFSRFPDYIANDLKQAAVRIWGTYREPLSHQQRCLYLQRLVSQEPTTSQEALERLWRAQEEDLERLPVGEQERIEQHVAKKADETRRKRQTRGKRRLS